MVKTFSSPTLPVINVKKELILADRYDSLKLFKKDLKRKCDEIGMSYILDPIRSSSFSRYFCLCGFEVKVKITQKTGCVEVMKEEGQIQLYHHKNSEVIREYASCL